MKTVRGVLAATLILAPAWALHGCAEGGVYCVDGVCYYGYYYDSLVSGLTYAAQGSEGGAVQTGVTGEDNDAGRFRYQVGDSVTFSLGDTVLGQSPALTATDNTARVTPFDLAGVAQEIVGGCAVDGTLRDDAFRIVHNLAVLLQTFDDDGDPTNGIDISSDVAALFDGVSVSFDQAWEDFQADSDLQGVLEEANAQQLFPGTRELVAREDALRALYEGLGLCP